MFTAGERLIIVNQFRLLELLEKDKDSVAHYREMRKIVERGYSLSYHEVTENLWTEMPETECREVMDILDMFRVLKFSVDALDDKSGIDMQKVRFGGFDGNNESSYLGYAKFLTQEQGRWEELKDEVKNSHSHRLGLYRPMLKKWRELTADQLLSSELSKEQVVEILEAPYKQGRHSPIL
jgi:uncharacterized protein YfbU (UPF0304 family)